MKPDVALVIPEVNPQDAHQREGDHRQPELLDDADGHGPQAAARRGRRSSASSSAPIRPSAAPASQGTRRSARRDARRISPDRTTTTRRSSIRSRSTPSRRSAASRRTGYTSEELKMVYETRKILGDASIQISADVRAHSGRQLPQRDDHGRDRAAGLAGGGPRAVRRVPGHQSGRRSDARRATRCRPTARAATRCSSAASAATCRTPTA